MGEVKERSGKRTTSICYDLLQEGNVEYHFLFPVANSRNGCYLQGRTARVHFLLTLSGNRYFKFAVYKQKRMCLATSSFCRDSIQIVT